jgi:hypothetical protein
MPPSATLSAAIVKHIRAFVRCACATDAMQPMISSAPLSRFLKYKGTLILFHLRNPAPPGGLGRLLEFYASTEGAKAMPERRDERIVETETEARAGVTGHNVRYVLALGLGGVIVAFTIIYFVFFG